MTAADRIPTRSSVSEDGTLVYLPNAGVSDSGLLRKLFWKHRNGDEIPIEAQERLYRIPRISPDGRKIAIEVVGEDTGRMDIWIYDIERSTSTRLTFDPGDEFVPTWSDDGSSVMFASIREGDFFAPFLKAANGTGSARKLTPVESHHFPTAFYNDGQSIITDGSASALPPFDIHTIDLESGKVTPLLASEYNETNGALSPDERWLSYTSDESGRSEVYVRPFPDVESGKWLVSTDGGSVPLWSPEGTELFFLSGRKLMVAAIEGTSPFRSGAPEIVFDGSFYVDQATLVPTWAVARGGDRILIMRQTGLEFSSTTSLIMVENWFEVVRAAAPLP